jgi:type II secretory pathway predicted ATPase ExeA
MNYAYFGLKQMPFSKEIDSKDLFKSYDIKEAFSRLNYIKQHRGIFLLTGEPGGGKTSAIRKFVDDLSPQSYQCCYTPHSTVSRMEVYRQFNSLLCLQNKVAKNVLFEQIQNAIWDKYRHQGITPCFILDECHLMDQNTLQELVIITNFKMDSRVPFILILCGQPYLKDILKRRALESLNQRITLKYHMAGLSLEETRSYILHHLQLAGRKEPLFEEGTVDIIHQLSLGLPRKVGSICIDAMIYAEMKQLKTINNEVIHQASIGL